MQVGDLILVQHPPIPVGMIEYNAENTKVAIYLGDDPDCSTYNLEPISKVKYIDSSLPMLIQKKFIIEVLSEKR
tara:strand:+ start:182 stop:403 length:222 start_codon:yes stop_codon:yes gene_type:complete